MMTISQGFSVVTKAFTMVNDHWPAIILSTVSVNSTGHDFDARFL